LSGYLRGWTTGIYLDERKFKIADSELNLLKTRRFIFYIISSLFLISVYLILIRIGNTEKLNDNLYVLVSILVYLASYSIAYFSFYSLINSIIKKYEKILTINQSNE